MKETNTQNESKSANVSIGRRGFIKLTAVGAGIGTASVGSISIAENVRGATSNLNARTHGGQVTELIIDGSDDFEVEWNDVNERSVLEFNLEVETTDKPDLAHIGQKRINISSSSGSTSISLDDFYDADGDIPLLKQHPNITPEDISVDLDAPKNSPESTDPEQYIKTTEFNIYITAIYNPSRRGQLSRRPDNAETREEGENDWGERGDTVDQTLTDSETERIKDTVASGVIMDVVDLTLETKVVAVLGAGVYFGKEFGVTNPDNTADYTRPDETYF